MGKNSFGYVKFVIGNRGAYSISINDKALKKAFKQSLKLAADGEHKNCYFGIVKVCQGDSTLDYRNSYYVFTVCDENTKLPTIYAVFDDSTLFKKHTLFYSFELKPDTTCVSTGRELKIKCGDMSFELQFRDFDKTDSYESGIKKTMDEYINNNPDAKKAFEENNLLLNQARKERQAKRREKGYNVSFHECHSPFEFQEFYDDYFTDDVFWGGNLKSVFNSEDVVEKYIFLEELEKYGYDDKNVFVRMIKYFIANRNSEDVKIVSANWYTIHRGAIDNSKNEKGEIIPGTLLKILKAVEAKVCENYMILTEEPTAFKCFFDELVAEIL